jgi:hypothetical protein
MVNLPWLPVAVALFWVVGWDAALKGTAVGGGFFYSELHRLESFASALLHPAIKLIVLTRDEFEIVVRQVSPFFPQLAFDHVPVAFDFKGVHICFFCLQMGYAAAVGEAGSKGIYG